MFYFHLKCGTNARKRLLWISTVFQFMSVSDVSHEIGQHDSPGITLVRSMLFPQANSEHTVDFALCQPDPNHLP